MSGRNERAREEILASGSTLAHHSINQRKTGRGRWGERRIDSAFGKGRKALRAQRRPRKGQGEIIIDPTGNVGIAPKGIVFPEDIG